MLNNFLSMLKKNDDGQDLLEYALLVALIAIVAVGAVTAAGHPGVEHLQPDRGRHLSGLDHAPGGRACRRSGRTGSRDGCAPQQTASSTMGRFVATVIAGLRQQDGQDLLEYAMLCALIAIVAVSAVQNVGNTIHTVLWQVIAAASF